MKYIIYIEDEQKPQAKARDVDIAKMIASEISDREFNAEITIYNTELKIVDYYFCNGIECYKP